MEYCQNAFQFYWNLSDNNLKWQCLINWTEETMVKKIDDRSDCLIDDSESDPRIITVHKRIIYKLPQKDTKELVAVCQKMFKDTLGKLLFTYLQIEIH